MTKVLKEPVKCIKCGKESDQLFIFSINYSFGSKEDNDKLMKHQQECPYCGYKNWTISKDDKENEEQ